MCQDTNDRVCGNCVYYRKERQYSDTTGTPVGIVARCDNSQTYADGSMSTKYYSVRLVPATPACPLFTGMHDSRSKPLCAIDAAGVSIGRAITEVSLCMAQGLFQAAVDSSRGNYASGGIPHEASQAICDVESSLGQAFDAVLEVTTESMRSLFSANQYRIEELELQVKALRQGFSLPEDGPCTSSETQECYHPEPSLEQTCQDEPE